MSLLIETTPARRKTSSSRSLVDRPLLLCLCFALAYLVTWAGHLDSGDSAFRIAWAKAMLFHHTARIDDYGLGATFCKYSIGHSLLAMPFLAVAEGVRRVAHIHAEGPIYMLLFVINAAVFLTMVAKYLRLRFGVVETRRTLLLLGFATVWLPCSRMDSIEQLVLTFLFGGFLLLKLGRLVTGILVASCAVLIRPDSLIAIGLLVGWHLYQTRNWKAAMRMTAALLPALAINAVANWVRWGTFSEAGYAGEPFSEPLLAGLHGILFSSGKSIFLYSPPLILGVVALFRTIRGRRTCPDYWFFLAVLVSEVLLYSCWWDWSGDDCWGVRFLNPGVMLMCIPAAELLGGKRWPRPAIAVGLAGLAVQSLAVVVDPMAADYVIRHYPMNRLAYFPGKPSDGAHRVDIDDLRFNPRFSPLAVNWLMLRVLLRNPPTDQPNFEEMDRTGTPLYLSLLASGWDSKSVKSDLFWVRFAKDKK